MNTTNIIKTFCLTDKQSRNYKRIKRKCIKKYTYVKMKHAKSVEDYLHTLKSMYVDKSDFHMGIVCDNVYAYGDQYSLPELPDKWDVLFLNYQISEYNWGGNNTPYWVESKVSGTFEFIVNNNIKKDFLKRIRSSDEKNAIDTWDKFINLLNSYGNTYTLTQYPLSEINSVMYKNIQSDRMFCFDELECQLDRYNRLTSGMTNTERYLMLPSVSLLYPITDVSKIANMIYSFMSLEYPKDKLELVIIDTVGAEKYFKGVIPEDKRIKIVKMSNKSNGKMTIGYQLNIAVKYATKDLLCGFMDGVDDVCDLEYYPVDYVNILVKNFLMTRAECIVGDNIKTIVYSKRFWKVMSFVEDTNDISELLYNFTYMRKNVVKHVKDACKNIKELKYLLDFEHS